nr:MAG TPA: hypothetical protein [Caudoviricetes sp.]
MESPDMSLTILTITQTIRFKNLSLGTGHKIKLLQELPHMTHSRRTIVVLVGAQPHERRTIIGSGHTALINVNRCDSHVGAVRGERNKHLNIRQRSNTFNPIERLTIERLAYIIPGSQLPAANSQVQHDRILLV